jgi:hypothetical protein
MGGVELADLSEEDGQDFSGCGVGHVWEGGVPERRDGMRAAGRGARESCHGGGGVMRGLR